MGFVGALQVSFRRGPNAHKLTSRSEPEAKLVNRRGILDTKGWGSLLRRCLSWLRHVGFRESWRPKWAGGKVELVRALAM